MSTHALPLKVYLVIFGALIGLTAVTTAIAYVDLGFMSTPVALAIAVVKMALVVLYFMHVRYSKKLIWIFAIAGVLWLLILFSFTLSDFATRPPITGWEG